jgi:hypothetical protein
MYIIEKYGWHFIRGSLMRSAGSRCRSYHNQYQYSLVLTKNRQTHAANKTLRVLVHHRVVLELQFILENSNVHIMVIIRPEWRLQ